MNTDSPAIEVARLVVTHGPISRAELGQRTGYSHASLSRLTMPFREFGLLVEVDGPGKPDADKTAGRPAKALDIDPSAGRFLGVKLSGDTALAVLTDLRANVLDQRSRHLVSRSPQAVAQLIAEVARAAGLAKDQAKLTGIGLCLGGSVSDARTVIAAPFLDWHDVPLADLTEQACGMPVTVANDVVALAQSHHWFGPVKDLADFAVITIGIGVGYGLVTQGHVVDSPEAGLGLGGHILLDDNGPPCPAGLPHNGCSAALCSSYGMGLQAEQAFGHAVPYEELLSMAVANEPAASAIIAAAARGLGRFIAVVTNLTMQPTVVLGGEGIGLWDVAADLVIEAANADRNPHARPLRIEVDSAGFTSWARGAATMAIQHALSSLD